MLLLAIDTSTSAITVAVHDGSQILAEAATIDARGHAEHLAPRVAEVLATAGRAAVELTDVVVGLGPGPFTGLRVGIVTARTLAFAVGARLHGLGSLDALAHGAGRAGLVEPGASLLVATDARRREVYWARYEWTGAEPRLLDGPHVGRAAELPEPVLAQLLDEPGPPLDHRHGVDEGGVEVEVVELQGRPEAVGVDMDQGRAADKRGMDPGDDEGRRGDRAADTEPGADALGQRGLPRAEVAGEDDQVTGAQQRREAHPEVLSVARGRQDELSWHAPACAVR